jgi:DNA (cytosine-5)-methyltransferase 1
LGWKAAFFSEIEKFPSAVLDHHYPTVPNLGDMTKFKEWPDAIIDVLVGGTPCQSFSIAGLRKGLDDPRGNLMLTYLAIAARYRPKWLVWENVPGVLSSNGGKDFGTLLGGLGELGYGFAYRILDAQYAGVPQRRRRVFVVGHLGNWRRAAAVLFERHSLSGNTAPSRQAGKGFTHDTAPCLTSSRAERIGNTRGQDAVVAMHETGQGFWQSGDVAGTIRAEGENRPSRPSNVIATLSAGEGFDASEDGTGRGTPLTVVPTLTSNGDAHSGYRDEHGLVPVAFAQNQRDEVRMMHVAGALAAEPGMKQQTYIAQPAIAWSEELTASVDCAGTIQRGGDGGRHDGVMTSAMQVRRLTPLECERLQGFPDDYTLIPGRAADGPRYKALGNSMAVPVMSWIGQRIAAVDAIKSLQVAA